MKEARKTFSYPPQCLLKIPPVAGEERQDVEGMGKPLILYKIVAYLFTAGDNGTAHAKQVSQVSDERVGVFSS